MRILFISSHTHPASGVSCLYNQVEALKSLGHECYLLSENQHYVDIPSYSPRAITKSAKLVHMVFSLVMRGVMPFIYSPFSANYKKIIKKIKPDIINVHWTHGPYNVPLQLIAELSEKMPIAWTIHDMWPMTGGCFYTGGCDKFNSGCGRCPQNKELKLLAGASRLSWTIKKKIYKNFHNLALITPSQWLFNHLKGSIFFNEMYIKHIPNSVDIETLVPIEKNIARKALNVPIDAKVLFVLSKGGSRKGDDLFELALADYCSKFHSDNEKLVLLVGGRSAFEWNRKKLPSCVEVITTGMIQSQRMLAICHSCTDIFVLPTKADNLPTTILEAQSCGTPVASFRVGGVPEELEEGITGYLAEPEDYKSLSVAIDKTLKLAKKEKTVEICRNFIIKNYSRPVQAKHCEDLFKEMI